MTRKEYLAGLVNSAALGFIAAILVFALPLIGVAFMVLYMAGCSIIMIFLAGDFLYAKAKAWINSFKGIKPN